MLVKNKYLNEKREIYKIRLSFLFSLKTCPQNIWYEYNMPVSSVSE